MNFKQQLLLRHKNPVGLVLRLLTYLGIGVSLWFHQLILIFLLLLVDLLNWFFMPMVKAKNEAEWIKTIVQTEVDFIKSPWNMMKVLSVIVGVLLFGTLSVGLWMHHWVMLITAFILIAILKQLILKLTAKQH